MKRSVLLGIAGGSGSGKTTVARALAVALGPGRAVLLSHDHYYRPIPAGTNPDFVNFDAPDALDNALLAEHLAALREGHEIEVPGYDFATCSRQPGERVRPAPVVVVEGILLFAVAELAERFDLRVYVDTPEPERLYRRIMRDTATRGRDLRSVLTQYFATVRPMHELHVQPSIRDADLVVDGTRPVDTIVSACVERVHAAMPKEGPGALT